MPGKCQMKAERTYTMPMAENRYKRSNNAALGRYRGWIGHEITGMAELIIIRDLCQNAVDACYHWLQRLSGEWRFGTHNNNYGAFGNYTE